MAVNCTQTADSEYIDGSSEEVRRLKAEVLRSQAESASLQHALQLLRQSVLGNDAQRNDVAEAIEFAHRQERDKIAQLHSSLIAANNDLRAKEEQLRQMNITAAPRPRKGISFDKAVNTDDPILDLAIPTSSQKRETIADGDRFHKDELASLRKTVELQAAQLRQARADLAAQLASQGDPVKERRPETDSIGVMVDTMYNYEKLFAIYRRPFTPECVESLLLEADSASEQRAATESMQRALATQEHEPQNADLQSALDTARRELIEAHEKIDELHYALDLERRDRAHHGDLADTSVASKQATAEISFLCDTLAATRSELELLQRKATEAEAERDAAVGSFEDLKRRTKDMFEGCQHIAETTRRDADESIMTLSAQIRQKDHEVNTLRGQIAALHRTLENTQQSRDSIHKEAEAFKSRITALTSSITRLREDYNAQSVALREARSFAASFSSLAMQSPRPGGATAHGSPSAKPSGKASPSPIRKSQGGRSTSAEGHSSGIQALAAALKRGDSSPRAASEKKAATSDNVDENLKEECEEFRNCFLMLAPLVPQAETAREVASGVCAGVEKLNSRIASLEREVKKKTVALQTTKKDFVALQESISALERKAATVDELNRKVEAKEKAQEKSKRLLAVAQGEADKQRKEFELKISSLESELGSTNKALLQAKKELAEGRELMMNLLKEEDLAVEDPEPSTPPSE